MSFIILLVLLLPVSSVGGYLYFSKFFSDKTPLENKTKEDVFILKLYYPRGDQLYIEERRLSKMTNEIAIAEVTVKEFLKGPTEVAKSDVPQNTTLLGIYRDANRIFYIDLSDEFRRNFHGDALTELLLLKGLYESIVSNIQDVHDIKVLIEGKEIETLGGHFYLSYPLKDMVSNEVNTCLARIINPNQSSSARKSQLGI